MPEAWELLRWISWSLVESLRATLGFFWFPVVAVVVIQWSVSACFALSACLLASASERNHYFVFCFYYLN